MIFTDSSVRIFFVKSLIIITLVFLHGCGSGGGSSSQVDPPRSIDVPENIEVPEKGAFTGEGLAFGFGETADPEVEIWHFDESSEDITSPAIATDGSIYVGSEDKYVYAVHPNGSLKWKFRSETGTGFTNPPVLGKSSTIFIADEAETIYALNSVGEKLWSVANIGGTSISVANDGQLFIGGYSLNPEDGSTYWYIGFDPSPRYGGSMKPVLEEVRSDTVYIVHGDALIAYELLLGTEKWVFELEQYSYVNTEPAIGSDGTLYFGDDDGVFYALNDDGTEKWRLAVDTDSVAQTSPVIGLNGDIYVYFSGVLYAFSSEGSILWDFEPVWSSESPVIGKDGTIYIVSNVMYALDTEGNIKWEAITYTSGRAAPLIDKDGFLLAPLRGDLYKLDVNTGGIAESPWPYKYGGDSNSSSN